MYLCVHCGRRRLGLNEIAASGTRVAGRGPEWGAEVRGRGFEVIGV